MLDVIRLGARPAPDGVLRAMFAARKEVFVDLLRWDVPVLGGKFEVDQYDDAHATYLVLGDADGAHLGSARLLPTSRAHILDSFFPTLCENGAPRGDDIFEITRFCLDRGLSAKERRKVRDTLVTALVQHALATGIKSYTAIAEMPWFQQVLAFGWRCRPLGLPQTVDGAMLVAFRIDLEPDTLERLAAAGICATPAIGASALLAA